MNRLLTTSAIVEAGAGVALCGWPSVAAELLFGLPLETSVARTLARVLGTALLALAVGCWISRQDRQGLSQRVLASAMTLYNLGTVVILGAAGVWSQTVGILLWPGVILHVAMAAWCIWWLLKNTQRQ